MTKQYFCDFIRQICLYPNNQLIPFIFSTKLCAGHFEHLLYYFFVIFWFHWFKNWGRFHLKLPARWPWNPKKTMSTIFLKQKFINILQWWDCLLLISYLILLNWLDIWWIASWTKIYSCKTCGVYGRTEWDLFFFYFSHVKIYFQKFV